MTWTPEVTIPSRQAALDRIDGGSSPGPAAFRVYDSGDALLVELPLAEPAGQIDGQTGAFDLTPGAAAIAAASGDADYADLVDSDGVILNEGLPAVEGGSAQPGHVVLSSVSITQGAEVELISAAIGG